MNLPNRPQKQTAKPQPTSASPPKAAPQANPAECKPQPPQTQAARRTVRFEVGALKASSASVAGTFNDWKPGATPFRPLGGGRWVAEISLAPGRYEYRFVVDGKWVDPPHAKAYVPNPHGGRNAVVQV